MTAVVGAQIIYTDPWGDTHDAIVDAIVSGDTINLVAFTNGTIWGSGSPAAVPALTFASVPKGVGINTWTDGTATATAVNALLGAAIAGALVSTLGVPPAGTGRTPTFNTAYQPNATRPTLLSWWGSVTSTLTLTGTAGQIEILSDASNPPATTRGKIVGGATNGIAVAVGLTLVNGGGGAYIVPAGHFVMFKSTSLVGTPTYSATTSEQTL